MILETERLLLRPWRAEDAEELYKYASDPQVGPIAGWSPHTSVENSLEIINDVLSQPENYAVVLKETGKPVGSAGIMRQGAGSATMSGTEAEIGYWIGVPYWGRGLISEAVRELLRRCFADLGCTAVWCGYFDGNQKSKRVQEKCGFVYHHTEENRPCAIPGSLRTEHFTRISKVDWLESNAGTAYRILDLDTYYRRGVYRHFTEDCKCSTSMTARVDVTELYDSAKKRGTKFYIDFLYLLSKTLNSRDDYKIVYMWQSGSLRVYNKVNPIQYVFHEDTETCSPVYTEYFEAYDVFYQRCAADLERAKQSREYGLDYGGYPNWFDASYISWLSYDALHVEMPDGHLHFMPVVNWGRFREESGRKQMPLTVRLNHAVADGYLVARVFSLLEAEIRDFCREAERGREDG